MAELSKEDRTRFEGYARELADSGDAERLEQIASVVGLDEHARRGVRVKEGARGMLDAFVVIERLPRDEVRRLLPAGLELAPQPLCTPDLHPVFFMFTHEQLDSWFGGVDFRSLMLGVPWVQHADPHVPHRGPFIYRPRQYVDDTLPRVIGNRVYGLERTHAEIEADDNAYRIYAPHSRDMLVEGWFERRGDSAHPGSFARFEELRPIFDQPTVTQARRIVDENAFHREEGGPLFGCINRYLFDDPSASLTPVRAVVRVKGKVSPPAFPRERIVAGSLLEQEFGAFHIRVPQELSLPTQSSRLRFPEPSTAKNKRIVVLGGGPASCAAAFYLAKTGRYDVTMYTLGFRLGGKCAAGRNRDKANRIEEHGLHAFLGFYNNAFRTMREVYEVAGLPLSRGMGPWSAQRLRDGEGPLAEGFSGTNTVGLMGQWPDAEGNRHWSYYPTTTEINDSVPGVVPFGAHGPTGFARAMMVTLKEALRQARLLRKRESGEVPASSESAELEGPGFFARFFRRIALRFGDRPDGDGDDEDDEEEMLDIVEHARKHFERATFSKLAESIASGSTLMSTLGKALERLRTKARTTYAEKILEDPQQWFEWSGLDLMLTITIGLIAERAIHFDQLDELDLVEWLRKHGIAPGNERSPVVLFLYDSSFATSRSEPIEPGHLAAGVGLRWFLLLLDYHGFQVYEFRYSCPQTLMTPYYRALKKLGVEIRFFHKVEALKVEMKGGERRLVGVQLHKQATVKGGPGNYDPLWLDPMPNTPRGMTPWPIEPDYRQLEEGQRLAEHNLEDAWTRWPGAGTVELRQGEDFDHCVCGMSLGALPAVTRDLVDPQSPAYSEPWAQMIGGMALCQTISMQLWMERPEVKLYGPGGTADIPPKLGLLTQFAAPESSFGNFSHLIEWESWDQAAEIETPPAFLAYHTGALASGQPLEGHPFSEHDYPSETQAAWRTTACSWLRANYHSLYNRAPRPFSEFCEQLVAPKGVPGEDRLAYQFFNVGMQPWDLYVLSHPGTTALRLGQSESWCKDLFLCGDWTRTDINAGCVEAATQSGMLCARVMSQHPRYIWHVGF